ncbi:hypothetical protein NHX12_009238 [Muraenolepis orangiensis]|uniref:Uncharacterized protein n=1 Tax=Muraenolepis orangiensis TaxID=630683 RepID=A0A9Q0DN45_9TELE|nr:hypothetical protein NHX12_009238 [Muraenolepis orangiensis]
MGRGSGALLSSGRSSSGRDGGHRGGCVVTTLNTTSYERKQRYEIQVMAWDCGQQRALLSAPVRIHVKPVCKPGWQGWNKRVDYEPGTGSKQLFPSIYLEMCDGDHRGAPEQPHREGLRLRDLLREVPAEAVW